MTPLAIDRLGALGPGFSVWGWLLRRLAQRMTIGSLLLHAPDGERFLQQGSEPGPEAVVVLHRWRAVRRLLMGGDLGLAEAYMDGDWSSPDLTAVIELGACNLAAVEPTVDGVLLSRVAQRLHHARCANTARGARRNIESHYDLGNDFYAAWLDPGMTYSSALYDRPNRTLEEAQALKQERVMALLDLSGGERVLEIGCGWGGLASRLARECGARVTGITLSPSQLAYARRHLADTTAEMRLQDYREVGERYDRIVSIEMLEAVGAEYWPEYFAQLKRCLVAGGSAVLQVISIAEARYEAYRGRPDFIQRHVFPGGMLPSVPVLRQQIEQAGLRLESAEMFGRSYARTLAEWRIRFHDAWPRLLSLGFDERFRRRWEYYLSYCEAGFRAGTIDVGLYRLTCGEAA